MLSMITIRANLLLAALLSVVLVVTGCAAKNQTTLKPAPPDANPEPQLATDVHERVKELGARAQEYADGCNKLPGRSAQEENARRLRSTLISSVAPPAI